VPISAVDCVQPAIQHTREQLFSRFRWGQWSRLALVGILAAELHVGGCSFGNFNLPINRPRRDEFLPTALPHIDPARIAQFAGLIAAAILLGIVLYFIFLYINSMFRFILFDSVLRKDCSISEGWARWHRSGRRYFLWQIVFQISFGLFFAIVVGIPLALATAAGTVHDTLQHPGRMLGAIILLVGLLFIAALAAATVQILARDFLVPVMALEGLDFADGWSRLLAIIRPEPGRFAIYLLLKVVLAIAAAILFGIIAIIPAIAVVVPGVVLGIAVHATGMEWNVTTISLIVIIGTAFLLLLIYMLSLVSVPATVFFPAYAMHFFASRYPNLNVLLNPTPVPPPAPAPAALPESPPPEPPPASPTPEPIG
jgi:hypothetical protein